MRTANVVQGSSAWLSARAGLTTASRVKDVMSALKNGGETASRSGYRWELIAERLSGRTGEHFVSADMTRGTDLEPIARAEYEVQTGQVVDQVGMVYHPTIERSSASPDGLINKDGAIEIKVPRVTNHLRWIEAGTVPTEHQPQCIWVMVCCEREWIDFVSFCPELPEGLNLFVVRMLRHDYEERIVRMEEEVRKFDAEVTAAVDALMQRVVKAPEPILDTRPPYEQLMSAMDAVEFI
jgi:hypothetical protein